MKMQNINLSIGLTEQHINCDRIFTMRQQQLQIKDLHYEVSHYEVYRRH